MTVIEQIDEEIKNLAGIMAAGRFDTSGAIEALEQCRDQMELDRSAILQYQLEVSALKAEIDEFMEGGE